VSTPKDGEVSETNVNLRLSFIGGIEPWDQLEATLAVQMTVIHRTLIGFDRLLLKARWVQQIEILSEMNKMARTFTIQMDALKRYRSKGEQKVTVQHVTVSEGGQAIVGDIHQAQKEAAMKPESHSPALTHAQERPMEPLAEVPKPAAAVRLKSEK
jgi:hypothetical protein